MSDTTCDVCGGPKSKTVPAGVSKKTGKSYDAFQACPTNHRATGGASDEKLDRILDGLTKIYNLLNKDGDIPVVDEEPKIPGF